MTRASKSAGRPAHIINLTDDDNDPLLDSLIPNPGEWQIWPLVAVVRRLADISSSRCPVVYRSRPSLSFSAGEVVDMGVGAMGVEITLSAPGLAAPGSALPVACIARVIDDLHDGGVLAKWLDGPGDRFMQAVEHAQARNNMAFSLAVGGESTAMKIGSAIIGNCAPLSSDGQTESCDNWTGVPEGAIGLAAIFVGPITTSGLEQLFEAFTALPAHVVEFAGAEVATIRPARVGDTFGAILGSKCHLPSAGIHIVIEGGTNAGALKWVREPARRRSLHRLAVSYIGSDSPQVRIYMELHPDNAPPAVLDGSAELGGLAILGTATATTRTLVGDT